MTITEAHLDTSASSAAIKADVVARVTDWTTTVDHRRIGRLFAGTGLLAGLGLLVVAVLLAADRIDSAATFLPVDATYQMSTLYRIGLPFLAVGPILLGLAIAVVPLQIGAANIAFPRAATLSYVTWLGGSVLIVGAFIANGGPGGGSDWNVQLFMAGLVVAVLGLLIASLCVVATITTMRAPGLTLDRVPMFTFANLIACSIMLLSWPVLLANLVDMYVSHRYGQVPFGNSTKIMSYIDWAVTHPGVSLFALPLLGFIGDAVATFARVRQPLRPIMMIAIGFAGLYAFGADLQRGLNANTTYRPLMILVSLLMPVPFLLVLGLAGLALKSGKPKLGAPLLFALAAGLAGLLAAAMSALMPFRRLGLMDPQGVSADGLRIISSTIYPAAQASAMLFAALLGGCGALAYWGPRLWGRRLDDKKLAPLAALGLVGTALVAIPEGIAAFSNQPIDEVAFSISGPHQFLNGLATAGYGLMALTVLGTIALALRGFTKGESAGIDPWEGQSLEWTVEGTNQLAVTSAEPLYDRKEA
jgi:heme/copper-type cytochrome/quinol oxidase subunit 1